MSYDDQNPGRAPADDDDAPTLYGDGTPTALPLLAVGSVLFGVYRIEERLGQGGMGEVYRAHHITMDEPRAIKMMLPELSDRSDLMDRFFREARSLLEVHHPAVVKCHDLLRDDEGRFFLVMEYIDGPSLATRLQQGGALAPDEIRALGARLSAGLAEAHQRLVHRDLSPDNVMLPGGRPERAKLIDFGIAKQIEGARTTADFVGKYSWASPEQLGMGGGAVDYRSDYYSLGLLLCTAALGRRLSLGKDPASAIHAREALEHEGPPAELPADLRAAIAPLLRLDPADRPTSIEALFAAPSAGRPPSVGAADATEAIARDEHGGTRAGKQTAAWSLASVGLIAALAGGAYLAGWIGTQESDTTTTTGTTATTRTESEPTEPVSSSAIVSPSVFERARMALLDAGGTLAPGATRLSVRPTPVPDGDVFQIELASGCDCHALVFSVNGPGDRIDLLYPNALEPLRELASGATLLIPSENRYQLTAQASAPGEPDDELVLLLIPEAPNQLSLPEPDLFGLGGGEHRWSASAQGTPARSAELLALLDSLTGERWIAMRTPLEVRR